MTKLRLAAFASVALLAASTAGAVPLEGKFTTAGRGDVRVGPDFIDWAQLGNIFGPTNGDLLFVSGTGSFSALGTTFGTIHDLNQAQQPVGMPFHLDNFITFAAQPGWNLALEFINPGAGTAAACLSSMVGAVCTPTGSPFTIVNLVGGGSAVALSVRGTLTDGSSDVSDFVGTFTTQFADLNAPAILALLASQGFVQSSHSAEFTVEIIPEPATLLLFGSGLLGAGFLRRRYSRPTS